MGQLWLEVEDWNCETILTDTIGLYSTTVMYLANECLTTLSLTVFTQRNFVADFLQAKCDFRGKTAILRS